MGKRKTAEKYEEELKFKKIQDKMFNDPLAVFRKLLTKLDVLEEFKVSYTEDLQVNDIDRSNYDVGQVGYPAVMNIYFHDLKVPGGLSVDQVILEDFGFEIEDHENLVREVGSNGQTKVEEQGINVEPFKNRCSITFRISGDLYDALTMDHPFNMCLTLRACPYDAPYWKQSLFIALQMLEMGNLRGAFMHLFIAFEGLVFGLTSKALPDEKISLYKRLNYLAETEHTSVPLYVHALREGRNALMHGSKMSSNEPDDEALLLMLLSIVKVYQQHTFFRLPEEQKYYEGGVSSFVTKYMDIYLSKYGQQK